VRRLLLAAAALWIGRWALLELAARFEGRWPSGPDCGSAEAEPGWMPLRR